jgi:hypothetical protein
LRDVEAILDWGTAGLGQALQRAIAAYGGTAGNFAVFTYMDTAKVKYEKAFAIPISHYRRHMRNNGLDDSVDAMLADSVFRADPAERERRLASLREAIQAAPIDSAFWNLLNAKLDGKFPGVERFRFVSSSNAEGLDGFTGAGLYESRTGGRGGPSQSIRKALAGVWSGLWTFNAFEERSIRDIDHKTVGMGVMVQEERNGAEAEGAAITVNPYDPPGYQPGFYVNVRAGEGSGSRPILKGAMDQYIYHYTMTGQPIIMLSRADTSATGATVLTAAQSNALGTALLVIFDFFQSVYGERSQDGYGMGAEFKLARLAGEAPGAKPVIIMKKVSPYRGWGRW